MFQFPARLIGGGVRQWLDNDREAAICALFRRSFYLEATNGDLVCIGPAAIGAGPLNMICDLPGGIDWEGSGLQPGARASISDSRITVVGTYEFDASDARTWQPPALSENWTNATLTSGLAALETAAPAHDLSDGLAGLVLHYVPEIAAARSGFDGLGIWLDDAIRNPKGELAPPPPKIASLIGLGPGLTPSGDDLVGGVMIALRMFDHQTAADCLAGWALPIARQNTGKISIAHLTEAAGGEGADALHRVIALIADGDKTGLKPGLDEIDAIGHSSGWDALAGAVAVMRRMARSWKPRVPRRGHLTAQPIYRLFPTSRPARNRSADLPPRRKPTPG